MGWRGSSAAARRETLPDGPSGKLGHDRELARPGVGRQRVAPPRGRAVEVEARVDDERGGDDLAPARVGDAERARRAHPRRRGEHALDLGRVDVLATRDDHVVDAADDVERAGLDEPEVRGHERRGDRRAVEVAGRERRGADLDRRGRGAGAGGELHAGQRDQRRVRIAGAIERRGRELAERLGQAVAGEERDAAPRRGLEQGARGGRAPEQHGAERGGRSPPGILEQRGELGRDQRRERAALEQGRCGHAVEVAIEQHDRAARGVTADHHGEAARVRDRQREQPAIVVGPPEVRRAGGGGGLDRRPRQHDPTGAAGRARGEQDERGPGGQRRGLDQRALAGELVRGQPRVEQHDRAVGVERRVDGDHGLDARGRGEHERRGAAPDGGLAGVRERPPPAPAPAPRRGDDRVPGGRLGVRDARARRVEIGGVAAAAVAEPDAEPEPGPGRGVQHRLRAQLRHPRDPAGERGVQSQPDGDVAAERERELRAGCGPDRTLEGVGDDRVLASRPRARGELEPAGEAAEQGRLEHQRGESGGAQRALDRGVR